MMRDRTLTRYEYPIPDETARRKQWAASLGEKPILYIFSAVFVFGSVWTALHPPYHVGHASVWGVTLLAVGLFGWAIYHHWKRPIYSESLPIAEMEAEYELGTYYVPSDLLVPIIRAVEHSYEGAGVLDGGEWPKVWRDTIIRVTTDPPSPRQRPLPKDHSQRRPEDEEPRELVNGDTVIGLAWPQAGYIEIYGPYLLKLGGFGYELSHIVDHYLWPGQPEGRDLERGRELGIRPLTWPDEEED